MRVFLLALVLACPLVESFFLPSGFVHLKSAIDPVGCLDEEGRLVSQLRGGSCRAKFLPFPEPVFLISLRGRPRPVDLRRSKVEIGVHTDVIQLRDTSSDRTSRASRPAMVLTGVHPWIVCLVFLHLVTGAFAMLPPTPVHLHGDEDHMDLVRQYMVDTPPALASAAAGAAMHAALTAASHVNSRLGPAFSQLLFARESDSENHSVRSAQSVPNNTAHFNQECRVCERKYSDRKGGVAQHLRENTTCRTAASADQIREMGCCFCSDCGRLLRDNEKGRGSHKSSGACARAVAARSTESGPPVPAFTSPLHHEHVDEDIRESDALQLDPQISVSTDSSQFKWVDEISPYQLIRLSCSLSVPKILLARWMSALNRTADLYSQARTTREKGRVLKLMILLPGICGGRWAGKKDTRQAANKCCAHYPILDDLTVARISAFLNSSGKPRVVGDQGKANAIKRHIQEGHLRKATKVLLSSGLAILDSAGIQKVNSLFPLPEDMNQPMPRDNLPHNLKSLVPAQRDINKLIDEIIDSLPRQSSPGLSGWSYAMLQDAMHNVSTPRFQKVFKIMVRDMLLGNAGPAADWLTAAKLICLKKPSAGQEDGVRPIACGEVFTRVASRVALKLAAPRDVLKANQFGCGGEGGVDPMLISMDDAIGFCDYGLCEIDLANAFGSMCRHKAAEVILSDAPVIAGMFCTLYNETSTLVTLNEAGEPMEFKSATGGKQGDPLMPLVFSLVMKHYMEHVVEPISLRVIPSVPMLDRGSDDDDEVESPERVLAWSYLDNAVFAPHSQIPLSDIIGILGSEQVKQEYGFSIKQQGCWVASQIEMETTGHGTLGSFIGGPKDSSSIGSQLTMDAAILLKERLNKIGKLLPLQMVMAILRQCFHPVLTHLLRTLPANVGYEGVQLFEDIMFQYVCGQVNDRSLMSSRNEPITRSIFHLPLRLGGLGFASLVDLKKICSATCFMSAQRILRNLHLSIRADQLSSRKEELSLCAVNLNLPEKDLLWDENCKVSHLQRRASHMLNEQRWKSLMDRLSPVQRTRLLEMGGAISKAWMSLIPTDPSFSLNDSEYRYGLRLVLQSVFEETVKPGIGCHRPCSHYRGINQVLNPDHFLTCQANGPRRTERHNTIVKALSQFIKKGTGVDCLYEQYVGELPLQNGTVEHKYSDLRFTWDQEVFDYDIGITTVNFGITPTWPSDAAVKAAVAADKADNTNNNTMERPVWDQELDLEARDIRLIPDVVLETRKFRQMAWEAGVRPCIAKMEEKKKDMYRRAHAPHVIPVIMTANGAMSACMRDLCQHLIFKAGSDTQERSAFRARLYGRLSVILLRFGNIMARDQSK